MVYVTSDLHGCSPEAFQQRLDRAGFTENDFLFVLGDVIDRGEYGAELLLWLTNQPNVQLILGNHEEFMLACDFLFQKITEQTIGQLSREQFELLDAWIQNGGAPTIAGLNALLKRDTDLFEGVYDYVLNAPAYECIEVGGKSFVLVHAGLANFRPDRPLSKYELDELTWVRPTLATRYYDDKTVIFGHTPTEFFGLQYQGKAVKTDSWICIDTGAAMGRTPMLLRLDDMKEFY